MKPFFDSNVLVYAYTTDPRRERAAEVLSAGGVISVQVLNEFTNVLRKKLRQDWQVIELAVLSLRRLFPDVAPLTVRTHSAALELARDRNHSFYDAMIIASALEAGCDTLFSEDMQHGQIVNGLVITNPFA